MKIERIDYINMDQSADRNKVFLKTLKNFGVDMSIVHRYAGHDVRNYSGIEEFIKAAEKAYPCFRSLRNYDRAGNLGLLWSTLGILHVVREKGQISLTCHDDMLIRHPLNIYNELLEAIPSHNFQCLQIQNCERYPYASNDSMRIHMEKQKKMCPEIWENFRCAGDAMFIISPAGADVMISAINQESDVALEGLIEGTLIPQNIDGCYAIVDSHRYYRHAGLPSEIEYLDKLYGYETYL